MLTTNNRGVISNPDYKMLQMQPADEWFFLMASDGIWEFLTPEEIVKFTAKKLRLKGTKETCKQLIDASRKRWAHVEGDYCDDITCTITMLNTKVDEGNANHVVYALPEGTVA